MSGFTKLFSTIVTSSIWAEDDKTRLVWVTLLALAGRDGIVEAAIPGIANAARVPLEDCERAIDRFQQPDKYSRSTEHEGRRIERVEGGYRLLNYPAYRRKLSREDRADYQRIKQAEYRERKASAAYRGRERRFIKAVKNGDEVEADRIAAEGLIEPK